MALFLGPTQPSSGFDVFGLFGERDPAPAPSADSLPYGLTIVGAPSELRQAVQDVSALHRLRADAPPGGDALVGRARADVQRVIDAMWGGAYYNADVTIEVAGVALPQGAGDSPAAAAAAERHRGRARVPVRILVSPGPRFAIREVRVVDPASGAPMGPDLLPPRAVALQAGAPATSAEVLAAQARIIDHFRRQSRPLARAEDPRAVVDHGAHAVDVTLFVAPGPVAGIGHVTVAGTQAVDRRVVESYVYARPGERYSPEAIASMRRSVQQIEALSAVRVREGERLDADGNLPILLEVAERAPRAAGVSARYSTLDGPAARATFTHRNLFGGAERLRLEADVFYLTSRGPPRVDDNDPLGSSDLGGRVRASFLMPALFGRTDLMLDALAERDRTAGYTSHLVNGTAQLRWRFAERFAVRAGIEVETGRATDILGSIDYTLVGFPVALEYDSTDNLLDPTRGVRAVASVAYYPQALGSTVGFATARANASAYLALDEDARYVLAGRLGLGSIVGAEVEELPASRRFFAGGGSSVRGFAYRSLGPQVLGAPIGGRSLVEGSIEARLRLTDTIGIVPFVDAGMAFRDSFPSFDERIRVAAGLGLRYYTPIGPIRVDVAVPVSRGRGDDRFGLYIGIGQAF